VYKIIIRKSPTGDEKKCKNKNTASIELTQSYQTIQLIVQEGQHPLTGQRTANFRLLANQ